jgi:NAD(P)-dependent dehydrogenase (short-subunit alcohol dehydrogenase family)
VEKLEGKVAVVTGGASGIGFAMAEKFAAEGMRVVIADVEATALSDAAAKLRTTGAEVLDVVTDVRDGDQVEALAGQAIDAFGGVHIACNNAGVAAGGPNLWETPVAAWEWTLGVNLWGAIHGMRSFVPRMIAQGEGHIVNTASIAGLLAGGTTGPYTVSKFGVVALSESLYFNLQMTGAPVRVSVLCPGWVNTRIGEAERNAPAELRSTGPVDPLAARVRKGLAQVLAEGMPPAEVAAKVVAAIRADRFWILPHDSPEWIDPIRRRMENIVNQRNPEANMLPGSNTIIAAIAAPD